jgi:hypothetical protein
MSTPSACLKPCGLWPITTRRQRAITAGSLRTL